MERKFCGKCGKPVGQCTCAGVTPPVTPGFGSTNFGGGNAKKDTGVVGTSNFMRRFDNITLGEGEVVVRQYNIGKMPKKMLSEGAGGASIVVTNKRVISKSDSRFLGVNTTSVEEIGLENVVGVKNYYSQRLSVWRISIAFSFASAALAMFVEAFQKYSSRPFLMFLFGVAFGVAAFFMGRTVRKPSYLFSVYASSTSQAMMQGSNMMGNLIDRFSTGIVFRYVPTTEAVKMMCEMGACIMDLKNKGDYAIDAWKEQPVGGGYYL